MKIETENNNISLSTANNNINLDAQEENVNIDSLEQNFHISAKKNNIRFNLPKIVLGSKQEIQISSDEPTDQNIKLWYQIGFDIDSFDLEIVDGELIIVFPDDAMIDFNIINNDLVVDNSEEGLDFNIVNNNLEVEYVN